jgi:hypothetical protein
LVEYFKRLRENPSIAKMEEGRSAYYTETSPGYSEPVPSVFKEYAFQEESLPKPKPILLELEEIEQGQLVPQSGSGIPVGGARRLIRRRATRSSRLVGGTIGRKPKRKRKYVRPRIKRQRRTTIRRRTRR